MNAPTKIVTRFPPSPTGFLHIGSARTALFSWLYARHHGGTFLLRIEDTDRERSTQAAVDAIFEGMKWLGLDWDNKDVVFQFARRDLHAKVAYEMLEKGLAYKCYCTQAELEEMRNHQKANGLPMRYDGRWRDRTDHPKDLPFVVRLKAPQTGETTVKDRVRGEVTVQNSQLDDMVLLRSDNTPTYMLSVVVDDHDMGVNTIIRGDDHFTNTFRQVQIIKAMGWPMPEYAHVPLIHGSDGQKFSKRHGALGVDEYRKMGYLPEAMRNYLLRLGWSHGDDEFITTKQAIEWFNLEHIVSSPARFDYVKLDSVNAHYMREMADADLANEIAPRLQEITGNAVTDAQVAMLAKGMAGLKQRAKNLKELAESAVFYVLSRPLPLNDGAKKILTTDAKAMLAQLRTVIDGLNDFSAHSIETAIKDHATAQGKKMGDAAQPLRAALSGSNVSPPIFEVASILGKQEVLARINDVL
ncbi:MAG: glutamate--tRNA ligase [Alphaproteobacteria bacterium]|nr:glutamate--tRNA ligase [Alphaproteobacteria bacterium]